MNTLRIILDIASIILSVITIVFVISTWSSTPDNKADCEG